MSRTLIVDAQTREKFSRDIHRPTYHFLPPMNWINDPNGLIQWKGVYHLFYQHNPDLAMWGPMHWGHAVSRDLIHWEHRPIALGPTPGGPDEDGCWSGCAVNADGRVVMVYSGNLRGKQTCCLAYASDDLEHLEKFSGNPVMGERPSGYALTDLRDHCVWREGDEWNMLMAAGIEDSGGAAFLYRSPDLIHWRECGPILTGALEESGFLWECPDLIPLGDKHALVVSVAAPGNHGYTGYFWGVYRDGKFEPEAFLRMDLGERDYYAPQSFVNEQGERIQIGWITEARSVEAGLDAGWSGLLSLPRLLEGGADGRLRVRPHPAVEALRGAEFAVGAVNVTDGEQTLPIAGRALEARLTLDAASSARRCGLKVLCAPDGSEETVLAFEPAARRLSLERSRSTLAEDAVKETHGGEVILDAGENLELDVFVDGSVIEAFINGRQVLTGRVYPTQAGAVETRLFAEGGAARFIDARAWHLKPIA